MIENRGKPQRKANRVNNNEVQACGSYEFMAVQGPPESVEVCNTGIGDFASPDNGRSAVMFREKADLGSI